MKILPDWLKQNDIMKSRVKVLVIDIFYIFFRHVTMDPMTVIGVKDFSPWDVISIYEFNFFCCPECDGKSRSKQEFINHASISHPQVS